MDTILSVSDKVFGRTIEKNVEKLADDYVKRATEQRIRKMEKLVEETSCSHLPIKKIVRIGVPFLELIKIAQEEKADLMVIGPKGRGNLEDVLFGSNAEKLFRRCPIPLLSMRTK